MSIRHVLLAVPVLFFAPLFSMASDAELQRFQGKWEVVELVEDGKVIPQNAIEDWLPSGGRLEIADNAIITTSHDAKKEVKVFSIDAATYPKGIEISTREKREVWGIYRFDAGRLVICVVDHEDGSRPDEFSARAGSKRMLLTLRSVGRSVAGDEPKPETTVKSVVKQPAVAAPVAAPAAEAGGARLLSDEELARLLRGSEWRYKDSYGALILSLGADRRFSTTRESTEMRLFQKVFVKAPVSSGEWSIRDGKLWLHVVSSADPARVNAKVAFTLRVVTDKDLIFVDYLGHVGQAVRLK